MIRRFGVDVAVCFGLLATSGGVRADGPVVHDQTDLDLSNSFNLSEFVLAEDFVIEGPTRITSAEVVLSDDVINDDGALGSFSGELSWQIRGSDAGQPGGLVITGRAVNVVERDTGIQDGFNADLVAVAFDFNRAVSLQAGTYWFVLREGSFGSPDDGSIVWWQITSTVVGNPGQGAVDDSPFAWESAEEDLALVLFGTRPIWDQSPINSGGGGTIVSSFVAANDFTLEEASSFSSLEAWLLDDVKSANGDLDNFSGALSWAIYANGANKPGTELAHGDGLSVRVDDAELQGLESRDVGRVRIALGRTVQLEAGTYWLALHEGAWASASDGSELYWYESTQDVGFGQWVDDNETAPGAFPIEGPFNSAFVLYDEVIFASGFESGVACGWTLPPAAVCP